MNSLRATIFSVEAHSLNEAEAVDAFLSGSSLLWIHLTATDREAASRFLLEDLGFHPLEVEDALSADERPTLRADGDGLFLVAPAVVRTNGAEHYEEIALFVQRHAVVSVARQEVDLLDHLHLRCERQPRAISPGVGYLVHAILDDIVDSYFPAVDGIADDIDELEHRVFQNQVVNVGEALALKRRLLTMRQQLSPLRDIVNGLLRRENLVLEAEVRVYIQDVYDHCLRLTEIIDTERDVLSAVLDAHLSMVSNSLNEVMKKMTVISTLLMTSAMVAGIYGMNFRFMPELQQPWGYPMAILMMVGLCVLELWFFRRKRWI